MDRGQAQSAATTTTTGEVKLWAIPLIDTFMKRLRQGGIIIGGHEIRHAPPAPPKARAKPFSFWPIWTLNVVGGWREE